jgi:hypothetical protein
MRCTKVIAIGSNDGIKPAFCSAPQGYGIGAITCDDAKSQVTTSAFISALR